MATTKAAGGDGGKGESGKPDAEKAAGGEQGAGAEDMITITRAQFDELRAEITADVRQQMQDQQEQLLGQMTETAKAAAQQEIAAGGKVRQIDPREASRKAKEEAQALDLHRLRAGKGDKAPKGCVGFMPTRTFHIARRDIPGASPNDEGASVEVSAETGVIWLPELVAAGLQRQGLGRVA